jgi:hypothetical protein
MVGVVLFHSLKLELELVVLSIRRRVSFFVWSDGR